MKLLVLLLILAVGAVGVQASDFQLPIVNGEFLDTNMSGKSLNNAKKNKVFRYLETIYRQGAELVDEGRQNGDIKTENLGLFMCLMSYYNMAEIVMHLRMWATPKPAQVGAGRGFAGERTKDFIEYVKTRFSAEEMRIFEELNTELHKVMKPIGEFSPKRVQKAYERSIEDFRNAETGVITEAKPKEIAEIPEIAE